MYFNLLQRGKEQSQKWDKAAETSEGKTATEGQILSSHTQEASYIHIPTLPSVSYFHMPASPHAYHHSFLKTMVNPSLKYCQKTHDILHPSSP